MTTLKNNNVIRKNNNILFDYITFCFMKFKANKIFLNLNML